MSHIGMYQPTRNDGKNWAVDFTVTRVDSGETVTKTRTFRIRADAYGWVKKVKNLSVEANEVRSPLFSNFEYFVRKLDQA